MVDVLLIIVYVVLFVSSIMDVKTIKKLRTENEELKKALAEKLLEGDAENEG